ncbi:MAG: signal peptidase II [bacterium]
MILHLVTIVIAGSVIILDQITKAIISTRLEPGKSIFILKDYVALSYVTNPGGAFGILGKWGGFFTVFSIGIIVLIIILLKGLPRSNHWLRVAFGLILGGAGGNLIDRLRIGEVIDFIDMGVGYWRWPAFNLADTCICLGVGMAAYHLYRAQSPEDS